MKGCGYGRNLDIGEEWYMAYLPPTIGNKPFGCKWTFTMKYNMYRSANKYKDQLVEKVFTQSYGVDYEEDFASMTKLNSLCVLFYLALKLDWSFDRLYIKKCVPKW